MSYQEKTGPLMANSHPGSYSGQDAYSDLLITENRGGYNAWAIGNGQMHQIHLQNKVGALNTMHDQIIVLITVPED